MLTKKGTEVVPAILALAVLVVILLAVILRGVGGETAKSKGLLQDTKYVIEKLFGSLSGAQTALERDTESFLNQANSFLTAYRLCSDPSRGVCFCHFDVTSLDQNFIMKFQSFQNSGVISVLQEQEENVAAYVADNVGVPGTFCLLKGVTNNGEQGLAFQVSEVASASLRYDQEFSVAPFLEIRSTVSSEPELVRVQPYFYHVLDKNFQPRVCFIESTPSSALSFLDIPACTDVSTTCWITRAIFTTDPLVDAPSASSPHVPYGTPVWLKITTFGRACDKERLRVTISRATGPERYIIMIRAPDSVHPNLRFAPVKTLEASFEGDTAVFAFTPEQPEEQPDRTLIPYIFAVESITNKQVSWISKEYGKNFNDLFVDTTLGQ